MYKAESANQSRLSFGCRYVVLIPLWALCVLWTTTYGDTLEAGEKRTADSSPLDRLDATKIPMSLRFERQPQELVAVFSGHRSPVNCLRFSADGKVLASGDSDGAIKLWDTSAQREPRSIDTGTSIMAVAFGAESKQLVSSHIDGTLILWDLREAEPKQQAKLREDGSIRCLASSPDGKTIASPGPPGRVGGKPGSVPGGTAAVVLWSVNNIQLKPQATFGRLRMPFGRVYFSFDGKTLACADMEVRERRPVSFVTLWDIGTRRQRAEIEVAKLVQCVALAPDDKTVAVAFEFEPDVQLYNLDGKQLKEKAVLRGHTEGPFFVEFARHGKLVSSGLDGRTIVWDAVAGKRLSEVQMPRGGSHSALAPDGRHLATVYRDGMIYVLRLR